MKPAENFLQQQLDRRQEHGLLRKLNHSKAPIDFCSNDYLGFARSEQLKQLIHEEIAQIEGVKNGATGSRLLSGNDPYTEATEHSLADFYGAAAGLIFNSGYDANIGLLSSIPQRGDTIILDELIHASLIDGARLSHAERYKFKHNDVADLEKKLQSAKGLIYVVVESVYSMDGDQAPLQSISELCLRYQANLIVDEAHAVGIFGKQGKGLIDHFQLHGQIFARIVTFGKALGTHGAIVLGSNTLRNYLINFARSFIYTTAAPLSHIVAVQCAHRLMAIGKESEILLQKINLYQQLANDLMPSDSAIQTILYHNNSSAKQAAQKLQQQGFDVRAILSPTVPTGSERLRICLHSYNTDNEIIALVNHLKTS